MKPPDSSTKFPKPGEKQDADIVLYDGECNFCVAQMERLAWWDRGGRLAYLSIHDPAVADRWPELPRDRLLLEMCVVEAPAAEDPSGQIGIDAPAAVLAGESDDRRSPVHHWGADAVRYLIWKLPALRWLAPALHLPGAMMVARPVYRFIARNRYLLGGKRIDCETDACALRH